MLNKNEAYRVLLKTGRTDTSLFGIGCMCWRGYHLLGQMKSWIPFCHGLLHRNLLRLILKIEFLGICGNKL